tara:strand:+ start:1879 stop:2088 length:210 start_codon:yes stop_codon:yes gene_type:complete
MKKMLNGNVVDMTQDEIDEMEKDLATANQEIQDKETAETTKANLKASAKAKLIAGEALTEEEANVMIGG